MKPSQVIAGRRYIRRDGRVTGPLKRMPTQDPLFYYATLDGEPMKKAKFVHETGYPWDAEKGLMHPEELVRVFEETDGGS